MSLFIDLDEGFVFYFDIAGDPIPKEIKALVEKAQDQTKKLNIKMDLRYLMLAPSHPRLVRQMLLQRPSEAPTFTQRGR